MAELSLGASPDNEAIAPAVIIGAIPASITDTLAAKFVHPAIATIANAIIGAINNFINSAIANGCISCLGSFNCNCSPTATNAMGTIVLANMSNTFDITSEKGVPMKNNAIINEINGGNVRILFPSN